MNIKIIVAAHKTYKMPEDEVYLPVHVGAKGKKILKGFQRDDEGNNISEKNANYCELTGLYWFWKNQKADAVGVCHYRRYFGRRGLGRKWNRIAKKEDFERNLEKVDVILPTKRRYFIETIYSQHVHAHHKEDLAETRKVLRDLFPTYLDKYDEVMSRTSGHKFNMFVMKWDILDKYCKWLFEVLAELEKRLDISEYSDYDARVFGYVSESLLDVWLEVNSISYVEMPVLHLEGQNWIKKIKVFLTRKVKGQLNE